jgi:hypothetical protein
VVACNSEETVNVLLGDRVSARIRQHSHHHELDRPRLLEIDYKGHTEERHGSDYSQRTPAKAGELRDIKQCGAFEIFTQHQGMLEASDTHHYVKPSLKHTDRFIRSGSVLVHGVEIEFLAVWLLHLLTNDTRHIYSDSSTINAVAFALVHLRNTISAIDYKLLPSIHSFESYKALKYESFPDKTNIIILISASSGGGMIQDLVTNYGVDRSKICTLFYLGNDPPGCELLCDLTRSSHNPNGYKPAIVTKSGDRGPFPAHSLAVHILAESFVPESPHVNAVLVTQDDIPRWWDAFKESFIGSESIACFAPDPSEMDMSNPPPKTAVIAVSKALKNSTPFQQRLDQMLLTAIPASLKTVIFFEDESTKAVIRRIKKLCNSHGRAIRWIKASQVTRNPKILSTVEEEERCSTLVVAGVMTDGTPLLDVAQILRDVQKNHALSFFVGLVACHSESAFRELRSNLVYSQSGVQFGFHFVQQIQLPRIYRNDVTCWGEEIEFWQKCETQTRSRPSAEVLAAIRGRLGVLRSGRTRGLYDELFLSVSASSVPRLSLRRNSVFTVGLNRERFSQADVFFAIQAVLHDLRIASGHTKNLSQDPHKRTVLSPRLFYRFTDGVIQAAFLRAAAPQELDYRMNPELSKQMGDTLCGVFQRIANPRAEAITEVLYALASGKLRLLGSDLRAFVEVVSDDLANQRKLCLERYLLAQLRARFLS